MVKKIFKLLFAFALVITCYSNFTDNQKAYNYPSDFSENEEYYYDLCSSSSLTSEQYETCILFREYAEDKNQSMETLIDQNNKKMADLRNNITEAVNQINSLQAKIDNLASQITMIEKTIKAIEEDIKALNIEIKIHEDNIQKLDSQIKERMVYNQANSISNNYIEFIMGSSDFSDLLRRIRAINELTQYDVDQINRLEAEKKALSETKEKQEKQQINLQNQKESLEKNKQTSEKAKKQQEELLFYYHQKEAELEDQTKAYQADLAALQAASDKMDKAMSNVAASQKFGRFMKRGFSISYGYPVYENFGSLTGGFHPAIDCAVRAGTPVYPIGNGIVVATATGCGYGYIGSDCNSGRGNYVIYACRVGEHVYGVYYFHLSQVNVTVGDVVKSETTVLGLSGSSGSSSGPHLHVMIIDIGKVTLQQAVNKFKTGDMYFGATSGLGYNLKAICSRKGKTPCIDNPMEIYNLKLKGYYDWSD